jgi:hypothetical protein
MNGPVDGPDGLFDGEAIVAMLRVRFSAGMPATITGSPPPTMFRQTVVQRHAYAQWTERCAAVEFPVAGPEMILGITQERLLVWRPAFVRSAPRRFAGAIDLTRIRSAGVRRRVFAAVLTLLLEDGAIVGVETTRAARLREFATAIPTYNGHKGR